MYWRIHQVVYLQFLCYGLTRNEKNKSLSLSFPERDFYFYIIMNVRQYLDSTYLKTATQAGLSEADNLEVVKNCIEEAMAENYKLVMIRPDRVAMARKMISAAGAKLEIGTVIDFPLGQGGLDAKLTEAKQAIADGADDLDFVLDYEGFKLGKVAAVREEVLECTRMGLEHGKVVKWIIEIAALNEHEIVQLCALVKNVTLSNFDESSFSHVFVKSSTGFYKTRDGIPNGATLSGIKLMLENSFPLPVKAAGGVRTLSEAEQMIALGVKRIGTSSAKAIVSGEAANDTD